MLQIYFRFPSLAALARSYLAIPATEVASERVFSTAGNTLTKLRNQLDPGTVDAIIFLHKNYVPKVSFSIFEQYFTVQNYKIFERVVSHLIRGGWCHF